MSERDELARIILSMDRMSAIDAILAAGFRKPRTITTAEELDALPETSVVADDMGTVALQIGRGLWTMGGDEYSSDELTADWLLFPSTVLYEPQP